MRASQLEESPLVDWIDVAQPSCLDPVIAAAAFKPNAPGRWELASLAALSERQLLKGTGSYFAERVLLAVTTTEVAAIDLGLLGSIRRRCRRWRRDELCARRIVNHDGAVDLPALALSQRYGTPPRVELAPVHAGPVTVRVLEHLSPRGLVGRGSDR